MLTKKRPSGVKVTRVSIDRCDVDTGRGVTFTFAMTERGPWKTATASAPGCRRMVPGVCWNEALRQAWCAFRSLENKEKAREFKNYSDTTLFQIFIKDSRRLKSQDVTRWLEEKGLWTSEREQAFIRFLEEREAVIEDTPRYQLGLI